jgi:hypothetical protein
MQYVTPAKMIGVTKVTKNESIKAVEELSEHQLAILGVARNE